MENAKRNIVSVSWGDHLIFGEKDGSLRTVDYLKRRASVWRRELGASTIYWRHLRTRIKGRSFTGKGYTDFYRSGDLEVPWDDLKVVPKIAHEMGMKIFLYTSIFDEGRPLMPKRSREVSYHNAMHGQHISWQSEFSRMHPEYAMTDRSGKAKQWGVLCLAYRDVRKCFVERCCALLNCGDFDGLFICLRSQSKPPDFGDQFGFNDPIRKDYLERYGRDICKEDFNLQLWRDLLGEYITIFLKELRIVLNKRDIELGVGVTRGEILGPPIGNTTVEWRKWVEDKIIDFLVIDQNSSKCPSLWHDLWPMHRGYGYVHNYVDGFNMLCLEEDLEKRYRPVFNNQRRKLIIARQWEERSEVKEDALLQNASVGGLVFGSFRHDNPAVIERNEWVI